ncbi:MAG: universal stress protein [Caldilineae bacterium]|nr:universal stress protein [Caldilineae bacterium]
MAAAISHKLSNAFEGALAGGGDPATSPLYVFGPFLSLIVVGAAAGVADVTFGPTVWLVVFTIAMVSAMYRLVMRWVTDGSGGSGLSEEEFGSWAVKINAGITFVEYTLTFLVSMSALVTFIADRSSTLRGAELLGIEARVIIAILLSIATGWLVNRGPKTAARFFGPATLAVLGLLWAMILSTLARHFGLLGGFPEGTPAFGILPGFDLRAFSLAATPPLTEAQVAATTALHPEMAAELGLRAGASPGSYFHFTLGGYVRILAVMTGIEVFANLVAAYGGSAADKARKAFGSLIIIMGTAAATMLVVGPAMFKLSTPADPEVSVFTQTMDLLLPWNIPGLNLPLGTLGTLIGIAVLLSASAASSQGLQNLFLGLSTRNYVPRRLGRPNAFGVADAPVWLEVAICCVCFLAFGAEEETYLAIYAAGVFILLSMTGWAAGKRLIRELRGGFEAGKAATLAGAVASALLTSVATLIIFYERFAEGAWTYFLFIPLLYVGFSYFRRQLGEPGELAERLAEIELTAPGGFGPGQRLPAPAMAEALPAEIVEAATRWPALPEPGSGWRGALPDLARLLVPLDGSPFSERALPMARSLAKGGGRLTLLSVLPAAQLPADGSLEAAAALDGPVGERARYLQAQVARLAADGIPADAMLRGGKVEAAIRGAAEAIDAACIVLSSHGRSGLAGFLLGRNTRDVIQQARRPVVVVRPNADGSLSDPRLDTLVVSLDGSTTAESTLPFARLLARLHDAEIVLLTVLEIPRAEDFGLLADAVAALRARAEAGARAYLEAIAGALTAEGLRARIRIRAMHPARAIIAEMGATDERGLAMLSSHGRTGLVSALIGNVAGQVVTHTAGEVFLVPDMARGASAMDGAEG